MSILRSASLRWTFASLLVVLTLYMSVYAWARATHRLVNYGGTFIAGPHVISGIGMTAWELVFYPATRAEITIRQSLGL